MAKSAINISAIDEESAGSAISSWSGFVYQGKVALYHSLKLIAAATFDRADKLQLDSLEDFSIISFNGIVLSIHQVKALMSKNVNTYLAPFNKLNKKGDEYHCKERYFHVAMSITDATVADIEKDYKPMKMYLYGGNAFCALKDIDNKIEEQISIYFSPTHPEKCTGSYISLCRSVLEKLIFEQVVQAHSKIHAGTHSQNAAAFQQLIPFGDLVDILECDIASIASGKAYFLSQTIIAFNGYYQDFCLQKCEVVDGKVKDKLYRFMNFVNSLNEGDMISFIKQLMPHRTFQIDTILGFKDNNIQKEEVQDAFFHCLIEFDEIIPLLLAELGWSDKDKQKYIPTSISSSNIHVERICAQIIENIKDTDLGLAFDNKCLVTREMNVDSVYGSSKDIMDVTPDEVDENYDNITRWHKITLIDVDQAKTKLK